MLRRSQSGQGSMHFLKGGLFGLFNLLNLCWRCQEFRDGKPLCSNPQVLEPPLLRMLKALNCVAVFVECCQARKMP